MLKVLPRNRTAQMAAAEADDGPSRPGPGTAPPTGSLRGQAGGLPAPRRRSSGEQAGGDGHAVAASPVS